MSLYCPCTSLYEAQSLIDKKSIHQWMPDRRDWPVSDNDGTFVDTSDNYSCGQPYIDKPSRIGHVLKPNCTPGIGHGLSRYMPGPINDIGSQELHVFAYI